MVYSACIFRQKCWERAGYSSAHIGKVYYTKVLLSVTEEDMGCPEVIRSVDPNSSDPNTHGGPPNYGTSQISENGDR